MLFINILFIYFIWVETFDRLRSTFSTGLEEIFDRSKFSSGFMLTIMIIMIFVYSFLCYILVFVVADLPSPVKPSTVFQSTAKFIKIIKSKFYKIDLLLTLYSLEIDL